MHAGCVDIGVANQTSNFKHSMNLAPDPFPVGHAGIDARSKKSSLRWALSYVETSKHFREFYSK